MYACGLNNYGQVQYRRYSLTAPILWFIYLQLGIGGTESKHFLTSIDFFEGRGVVSVKGGGRLYNESFAVLDSTAFHVFNVILRRFFNRCTL